MQYPKDTTCKSCVFAEWEFAGENTNLKFQSGCLLNLLQKYQKLTEVKYIEEDDKRFAKISNRICIGCRDKTWADQFLGKNKKEQVEKEWDVIYTTIFIFGQDHDENDVVETIKNINKIENIPAKIVLVSWNTKIRPACLITHARKLKTKWAVEFIVNEDIDTIEKVLDAVFHKTEGIYYSVYSGGSKVYDIKNKLYQLLRTELNQIVMLSPDEDNNGLTILRKAHIFLNGNKEKSLIDKIREICEENKWEKMIVPIKNLI